MSLEHGGTDGPTDVFVEKLSNRLHVHVLVDRRDVHLLRGDHEPQCRRIKPNNGEAVGGIVHFVLPHVLQQQHRSEVQCEQRLCGDTVPVMFDVQLGGLHGVLCQRR